MTQIKSVNGSRILAWVLLAMLLVTMAVAFVPSVSYAAGGDSPTSFMDNIVNGDGNVTFAQNDTTSDSSITGLLTKYKKIISYITGFAALTLSIFLIFSIVKFAKAADSSVDRSRAIGGFLTVGIAIALLGSISIILGFFWNVGAVQ